MTLASRAPLLFATLTLVAGCVAHWEPLPAQLPTAEQYADAAAVILDNDHELRFDTALDGTPVVEETVHVRARILREGGEALAHVTVPYEPALSEVTEFSARTIAPDGSEHAFSRSQLIDASTIPEFALYTDRRQLVAALSPALPGTLVEYRYTRLFRDLRVITLAHEFDGEYPEQRSRLTAVVPSSWTLAWAAMHDGEPIDLPPTQTTADGQTRMTWERRDLPALAREPFSAEPAVLATVVGVRLVRWSEHGAERHAPTDGPHLSAWLYDLTHAPQADGHAGELARSLVQNDPPDPTVRARRLYNWVRDHISYCAIHIGMGGLQPHASAEVARLRYGDCKDKANLLHDLLAAVDIDSQMVVLYAHEGMPLRFDPIAYRTNHAILRIKLPGGDVLADPTSRTTPFGALPVSDQEAEVLPLAHDGAPALRAPASAAADNERQVELELRPAGDDLTGTFHARVQGDPADRLRAELAALPQAEQAKPLAALLGLARRHLLAWRIEGGAAPDEASPVSAKGALVLRHGWPGTPLRILTIGSILGNAVPPLPRGERRGPLVFRCRRREAAVVHLAIDPSNQVALPPPAVIERPFGRYELRWTREPGRLVATRTLILSEHVFPARSYADLKRFFDEILAAEARAVTIHGGAS